MIEFNRYPDPDLEALYEESRRMRRATLFWCGIVIGLCLIGYGLWP